MNLNFEYKIVDDFFDKDDLDLILSAITEEEKGQVDEKLRFFQIVFLKTTSKPLCFLKLILNI